MDALESFDWTTAPASSLQAPIVAAVVYLASIAGIQATTRWLGKGWDTRSTQAVHNMVLCLWSLAMFAGCAMEVMARSRKDGWEWLLCESPNTRPTGPLFAWSYIYYISKFYELLDTVLQLLKGRPPPSYGLHVFHHTTVLFMAWLWLDHVQSLQFVGLLFNTFVHVIMYYYYYLVARGISPWWKKYITMIQIVQFVTSLACLALLLVLVADGRRCSGMGALAFNLVFNVALLVQFVGVLRRTAKRTPGKASKRE